MKTETEGSWVRQEGKGRVGGSSDVDASIRFISVGCVGLLISRHSLVSRVDLNEEGSLLCSNSH